MDTASEVGTSVPAASTITNILVMLRLSSEFTLGTPCPKRLASAVGIPKIAAISLYNVHWRCLTDYLLLKLGGWLVDLSIVGCLRRVSVVGLLVVSIAQPAEMIVAVVAKSINHSNCSTFKVISEQVTGRLKYLINS